MRLSLKAKSWIFLRFYEKFSFDCFLLSFLFRWFFVLFFHRKLKSFPRAFILFFFLSLRTLNFLIFHSVLKANPSQQQMNRTLLMLALIFELSNARQPRIHRRNERKNPRQSCTKVSRKSFNFHFVIVSCFVFVIVIVTLPVIVFLLLFFPFSLFQKKKKKVKKNA